LSISAFGGGGARFSRVAPTQQLVEAFVDLFTLGTPRYGAGAFIHSGKLYVVGGFSESGITTVIESIDLSTGDREYPNYLPEPRAHFAHGYIDGKFYVIGGVGSDSVPKPDIYEYDVGANTIAKKSASLPKGVAYCASVVLNGKIYIIGGIDENGNILADTYEYDPSSDTVTQRASMNVARQNLACAELGGYIYCFGGDDGSARLDVVERYDPSTDTWEQLTIRLPQALSGIAAVEISLAGKEYIMVLGG